MILFYGSVLIIYSLGNQRCLLFNVSDPYQGRSLCVAELSHACMHTTFLLVRTAIFLSDASEGWVDIWYWRGRWTLTMGWTNGPPRILASTLITHGSLIKILVPSRVCSSRWKISVWFEALTLLKKILLFYSLMNNAKMKDETPCLTLKGV